MLMAKNDKRKVGFNWREGTHPMSSACCVLTPNVPQDHNVALGLGATPLGQHGNTGWGFCIFF